MVIQLAIVWWLIFLWLFLLVRNMSTWHSCCTKMFCPAAAQKIRSMKTEAAVGRYGANVFNSKHNFLNKEKSLQMN